ncbi:hypothetical protein ABZ499_31740 [Streptomyces sp. NPDC019990]|uniref:hypothetical protein n=1 Tax=Streptomyces sp. NPDC019990 TaxID=3154693 RepID=UPI0033F33629
MPRSIQDILAQAALPNDFTDEDVTELKQEIVREVTATLMFGTQLAPQGHFPTILDRADNDLQALTAALLYSDGAAAHLAKFAEEPADIDGALHFACLLSLADSSDGAQWWWQFAAGAGNATAAHCLHLFHLGRGELRDADHWAHQAANLDTHIQLTPFSRRHTPRHHPTRALREAVDRLQVDEVEEWGFQVFRPDSHLAHQIEELADAP